MSQDPDATGGPCTPRPEQAREARRVPVAVAGEELDAFVRGIGDECAEHCEQLVIAGVDAVELAVVPCQGRQLREAALLDTFKRMGSLALHG
jgi:hypothetical protein